MQKPAKTMGFSGFDNDLREINYSGLFFSIKK